jgi:hypothetical protein
MPRSAKTEATSDGFSVQAALEHMSSSSPPPTSSTIATTATRYRHDEPPTQLNPQESDPFVPKSLPPCHPVGKRSGGRDYLAPEVPSQPPLAGEAAEPTADKSL